MIKEAIKMRGIACFLIGLSVASPALAKPAYLTCDMTNSEGVFVIEVTIDEDNQQVTINIPKTGNIVRRAAQFKADQVIVPDGDMVTYDFNRVDGTLTRRSPILANKVMDTGKCKVTKVSNQAF